jgi:hypothetical protein
MESIDYESLSINFKPVKICILLIGEAPPPNGIKYFYNVPDNYSPLKSIEDDTSLPASIFNHYFGKRPKNSEEYRIFLDCLTKNGIYLIDMINQPIKIRDRKLKGGLNIENLDKIFSDDNLSKLMSKINQIIEAETQIIFLFPRRYKKELKEKLKAYLDNHLAINRITFRYWKEFRLDKEVIKCK